MRWLEPLKRERSEHSTVVEANAEGHIVAAPNADVMGVQRGRLLSNTRRPPGPLLVGAIPIEAAILGNGKRPDEHPFSTVELDRAIERCNGQFDVLAAHIPIKPGVASGVVAQPPSATANREAVSLTTV